MFSLWYGGQHDQRRRTVRVLNLERGQGLSYAKVMPMWIHVRGTNEQGYDHKDRRMPRGPNSRPIRDSALQEEQ
ncbi:hypothetical protein M0804_005659 [Polistes exclamans]|nr:hypothetical protein M0804_005659 [Polistes exclamans]